MICYFCGTTIGILEEHVVVRKATKPHIKEFKTFRYKRWQVIGVMCQTCESNDISSHIDTGCYQDKLK